MKPGLLRFYRDLLSLPEPRAGDFLGAPDAQGCCDLKGES